MTDDVKSRLQIGDLVRITASARLFMPGLWRVVEPEVGWPVTCWTLVAADQIARRHYEIRIWRFERDLRRSCISSLRQRSRT